MSSWFLSSFIQFIFPPPTKNEVTAPLCSTPARSSDFIHLYSSALFNWTIMEQYGCTETLCGGSCCGPSPPLLLVSHTLTSHSKSPKAVACCYTPINIVRFWKCHDPSSSDPPPLLHPVSSPHPCPSLSDSASAAQQFISLAIHYLYLLIRENYRVDGPRDTLHQLSVHCKQSVICKILPSAWELARMEVASNMQKNQVTDKSAGQAGDSGRQDGMRGRLVFTLWGTAMEERRK